MWVFFHENSRITGLQGKGEGISLTPHYHFHPLHRHLDISRVITAGSSLLRIVSSRTRTGNLWFPSALKVFIQLFAFIHYVNIWLLHWACFTFFFDHNIEQNVLLFIQKQPLGDLLQNSCSKSVLSELNYACERDPFNSLLVFSEAAIQKCSKEKVF